MQVYNIIDIKKNSLVFTQQKVKSNNYNNLLPFISICCRIKIMSYISSCILSYQKVQKYEIVSTVAPSMNSLSNCLYINKHEAFSRQILNPDICV